MKNVLQITSLLCLLPMAQNSIAHPSHIYSDGYVYDTRAVVVRDGFGNCVRTTRWSTENAIAECDPDLFKQAAAPVTAAPPPAEPVVERAVKAAPTAPVSVKHAPMSMSLGTKESFDSNKTELKPAAKHRLSEFAQQVNAFAYGQFTIVGHADHTGSNKLNQTLSEQRANTVHDYLVSIGIPGDKIASNGAGSSQPITKNSDCAKLKSKKLQACLAPDRRVEITVTDIHTK